MRRSRSDTPYLPSGRISHYFHTVPKIFALRFSKNVNGIAGPLETTYFDVNTTQVDVNTGQIEVNTDKVDVNLDKVDVK